MFCSVLGVGVSISVKRPSSYLPFCSCAACYKNRENKVDKIIFGGFLLSIRIQPVCLSNITAFLKST